MFEKELEEKMKAIFKVEEVSFDAPGDSREQKKLWLEIEEPKFRFSSKNVRARVTGRGMIYGRNAALTYGFIAEAIEKADKALTKDLFFSEFETNTNRFRDIVERSFSFTYFFNSQFDPDVGTITSVTTSIEET